MYFEPIMGCEQRIMSNIIDSGPISPFVRTKSEVINPLHYLHTANCNFAARCSFQPITETDLQRRHSFSAIFSSSLAPSRSLGPHTAAPSAAPRPVQSCCICILSRTNGTFYKAQGTKLGYWSDRKSSRIRQPLPDVSYGSCVAFQRMV